MTPGDETADDALLAEQRDFYRADAGPFDDWLGSLLDETNDDAAARTYRAGRARFADIVGGSDLGRVLEVAAGTGRLAEVYVQAARSVVLLDSSPESLAIAAGRLTGIGADVRVEQADVFEWDPGERGSTP